MSAINVSSSSPRRLLYVQDQWSLEILRWQAIDRDLFEPVTSYVPGAENILRYLGEFDSVGHLLTQAERLLAQAGKPETVYEAQDGHWVAQTRVAEWSTPTPPRGPTSAPDLSGILSHMAQLEERLARLEGRLQGRIAENDGPTPSVRPMEPSALPLDLSHDEAQPSIR